MKLTELNELLKEHNVDKRLYSIDEGLKPNAYILFKNYSKGEYFFLDEKGDRPGFRVFFDESSAFEFFWEKIKIELKYPPSIPPKEVFG